MPDRATRSRPWVPVHSGLWLAGVLVWSVVSVCRGTAARAEADVSFNRDVRPILSDHCFACHGPDEKTRKGQLRLDREEDAKRLLKSGHRAIDPADLPASELIHRITTADADDRMPPVDSKKPLTPAKADILRRWVLAGARYEGHWAYLPPRLVEPPAVQRTNWPRTEIDAFVLARLEKEGLDPAPEAPREKLFRRVALDLTGLPPTVEELDAYLADPDPKAYEKIVDRLLASPHYGERMAQQWLDLARYGETQGYHHDRHRDQWHWRDWVIGAFNANKPFDQFTIEQLAGDLLPNPTRDQLVATGFHRNEMTTSEGGALPEEYIVKYAVGRVDTTARVWLGTSMACGECHDHKYDPISQRDYYRFFAFFFDTPENGLDAEELNPVPRITLETAEQRARAEQLDRELAALEAGAKLALEAPRADWDSAQAAWETKHADSSLRGWQPLELASAKVTESTALRQLADGTIARAPEEAVGGAGYELVFRTEARGLNGLRLEVLPGATDVASTPTSPKRSRFLLSEIEAEIRSRAPTNEVFPEDPPVLGPWHAVGPFTAGSAKEAYDQSFGPESTGDLSASYQEGKFRWSAVPTGQGDGTPYPLAGRNRALYLNRTIGVKEPRILEADFGGAEGLRVWLNGRQILASAPARGSERARVRLWLRAGENRLLVKLVNGEKDAGFTARLASEPVTSLPLSFAAAGADTHDGDHVAAALIDGRPESGWSAGTNGAGAPTVWLRTPEAFGFKSGTELVLRLRFAGGGDEAWLGRFRITASASSTLAEFLDQPEEVRAALAAGAESRTEAQRALLRSNYRLRYVPEAAQLQQVFAAKRKERDDTRNAWPTAMVMRPASPTRETQIRIRGQYFNKGEKVDPGVPAAIFPWRTEFPSNRLGLAKWLVHPDHPLTARVTVNLYWQRYFGTGLVKTAEEFGAQGEFPSHPELLDWLATRFVRSGWDVKAMQRLIVTSAAYRQDSVVTKDLLERDPENRLLARGPRQRLEAENIRDVAMAVSGLLNAKVGGPSVFPFQPPGLWGQVSFEGTRDYVQSEGADNYRRGLYTYWRRSIPYASFTIFDAPSREVCTMRRPRTNTPLQALGLMNDPVYVEAARAFAQRILAKGGATANERIEYAFRVALGRRPVDQERAILLAACQREFKRFAEDREAASRLVHVGVSKPPVEVDIAELAAWTMVANTLLNLDETITKG